MEIKWFMAHWTSSFKYTARCCGMCMCILPITTTHHLHASIPTRISRLATDHTTRTLAFQTPTRQRPRGGGEKRPGVNRCSTRLQGYTSRTGLAAQPSTPLPARQFLYPFILNVQLQLFHGLSARAPFQTRKPVDLVKSFKG